MMEDELTIRPKVFRFDRKHKRRITRGMRVQFGRTMNVNTSSIVDHYELSCPGYELTTNGPRIISPKKQELANDTK